MLKISRLENQKAIKNATGILYGLGKVNHCYLFIHIHVCILRIICFNIPESNSFILSNISKICGLYNSFYILPIRVYFCILFITDFLIKLLSFGKYSWGEKYEQFTLSRFYINQSDIKES